VLSTPLQGKENNYESEAEAEAHSQVHDRHELSSYATPILPRNPLLPGLPAISFASGQGDTLA